MVDPTYLKSHHFCNRRSNSKGKITTRGPVIILLLCHISQLKIVKLTKKAVTCISCFISLLLIFTQILFLSIHTLHILIFPHESQRFYSLIISLVFFPFFVFFFLLDQPTSSIPGAENLERPGPSKDPPAKNDMLPSKESEVGEKSKQALSSSQDYVNEVNYQIVRFSIRAGTHLL